MIGAYPCHSFSSRNTHSPGESQGPPKISEADLVKVERALEKGPKANGFPTELWTLGLCSKTKAGSAASAR
jgi:hypothetical protein